MNVTELAIPDVKIITPTRHADDRGFFSEIYSRPRVESHGIELDIVQENFAFSLQKNTVRGLHFQTPPFAQAKLVQVVRGAILDFAIDLRNGSPWYGQFVSATISADNWQQILIPVGFAHGLCTLGINWPMETEDAILSAKDMTLPLLADFVSPFQYEEASA